ncbi:MAG: hypothetical protein Aurels2KO_52280 [Aureliella sp.]
MNDESVFLDALQVSSDKRSQFVVDACGSDDAMRQRVLGLLAAHENPKSFLTRPADVVTAYAEQEVASAVKPGDTIGVYTVREPLGEGGMGSVFAAEQEQPVRRKVALKIIKPGMDTKQVIARFGAERQTLALMDHPNIAKVIDAGSTPEGRPFFVMELIRGIPITEYCDQAKMTTRDRLELFTTVCAAVEHAHQKGIIHRDLKPSNVLITEIDGRPVAKVIDFGVAKATHGQVADQTLYSNFAQAIGTPLYMSPEQTSLSGVDVDTRSDVYSLGVMFYELISGTTPFDREELKQVGHEEMCRMIREVDPPRPSARLSTLEMSDSSTVSENRSVDPRKLKQSVEGELDWIAMKALDKDRARRYASATAVAADIHRYLDDEPVEACPPSTSYRLRKFTRRNRGVLSTLLLLAAAMAIGLIASVTQAVRATYAEGLAEARLLEVDEQRQHAQANFALAMQAMDEVYINSIGVEKLLRDPEAGSGGPQAAGLSDVERELLQRGLEFYDRFADQNRENPDAAFATAGAFYRVALLQVGLQQNDKAEDALAKAIERFEGLVKQSPEQSEYHLELGKAYFTRAKLSPWWPEATEQFEFAKSSVNRAIEAGQENLECYQIRSQINKILGLHDESIADLRMAVELSPRDSEQHFQLARLLNTIQDLRLRDYKLALSHAEQATKLSPENFEYAEYNASLHLHRFGDKIASAAVWRAWLPSASVPLQELKARLSVCFLENDDEEAIEYIADCLELVDDQSPESLDFLLLRAQAYRRLGRIAKAQQQLEELLIVSSNQSGRQNIAKAWDCIKVAREYETMGNRELVVEKYNAAEAFDPNIVYIYEERGRAYAAIMKFDEAIADFEKTIELAPDRSIPFKSRARAYFQVGKYRLAAVDIAKAVELNPEGYSNLLWIPIDQLADCPDPAFAVSMLETATKLIDVTEGSAESYSVRGILHYAYGNTRASVADLVQASRAESTTIFDTVNWFSEGLVNQSAKEDYRDAIRILLKHAAELNGNSYKFRNRRLYCLLAMGDIQEACSEIETMIDAGEATYLNFYHAALISACGDNQPRYRELCSQMREVFCDSESTLELYFTAWSIGLKPDAVDDYDTAHHLAQRAIELEPKSPRYWLALAIIQLRSGEHLEAFESLSKFENGQTPDDTPDAYAAYLRAITEFRLKRTDDAKATLVRANELANAQLNDSDSPPTWNRKLTLELFRNEAEALAEKSSQQ